MPGSMTSLQPAPANPTPGHNSAGQTVRLEVKLYNSLSPLTPHGCHPQPLELDAGATVGDVVRRLGLPMDRIFLVLVNGRDVTPELNGPINTARVLEDGDSIAFSGPVPYSWGYGAPIV